VDPLGHGRHALLLACWLRARRRIPFISRGRGGPPHRGRFGWNGGIAELAESRSRAEPVPATSTKPKRSSQISDSAPRKSRR
jgi:hypothetical protein